MTVHVEGVPKGADIAEEIMAGNTPNLMKNISIQVQELNKFQGG